MEPQKTSYLPWVKHKVMEIVSNLKWPNSRRRLYIPAITESRPKSLVVILCQFTQSQTRCCSAWIFCEPGLWIFKGYSSKFCPMRSSSYHNVIYLDVCIPSDLNSGGVATLSALFGGRKLFLCSKYPLRSLPMQLLWGSAMAIQSQRNVANLTQWWDETRAEEKSGTFLIVQHFLFIE